MEQNYSSTKPATAASSTGGGKFGGNPWSNPTNVLTDNASSATWAAFLPGQGAVLTASAFDFPKLPDGAVIDGIILSLDGSWFSAWGNAYITVGSETGSKSLGALNGAYGGPTDTWGMTINPADIATLSVGIDANDVSGGDASASLDYLTVTLFWHIEVSGAAADVPTRVEYKTYSSDFKYLGNLPNVSSKFGFAQDKGAAGSSIQITCGAFTDNTIDVEPILDDNGLPIQDQNDLPILGSTGDTMLATGDSDDDAIFKNGNRIQVWVYDYWYPNGKLMFSGQVNRVKFRSRGSSATLTVYSDGLDLDQFIARGYPFNYTLDVSQPNSNDSKTVISYPRAGWDWWGQTFKTGAGVTNIGAIMIRLNGSADVTVSLYNGLNGNRLTTVTKKGITTSGWYGWENIRFDFPAIIDVTASTEYFFTVSVAEGQSILIATSPTDVYANGAMYNSSYSGGSGGGSWTLYGNDIYFETYYGSPTTTTTYTSQDPVTGMARNILLDYNARGGFIKERDFTATGLSLTYTFNSLTIFAALKKIIEMSPYGFYPYIDLGTAEIDILEQSAVADFTVVRNNQINDLEIDLSIEQVKNYLLFSGGETAGVNLFRDYLDADSASNYGTRMASLSDNRVTQTATADAIGNSFIEENSDETQETQLEILSTMMDITLLTPGKTIGFKNFGNFIDSFVLQIARREYTPTKVVLTLGRLPIRMSDEVERIQRDLLLEQTIKNPNAPS